MIIISMDYSYSKSGICVSKIENGQLKIIHSQLITSDKNLEMIPRILGTIDKIDELYKKYKPDIYIREGAFIGRTSTAKPVLYSHALLELKHYKDGIPIEDIHNASLKAFCKKYMIDNNFYTKEELKQFDKKEVVAEFLKSYFGDNVPNIYTKRGRLKDDECDAIALSVYYFENLK